MKQPISYRDPEGFVRIEQDKVYRYVNKSYAHTYAHLMRSGLYQQLVDKKLLIKHQEREMTADETLLYDRILIPDMVGFISYPSEWTPEQWKDMARAYLQLSLTAIDYGMILKDATPFNFGFHRGNCVLLDTLSFEFFMDGQPWNAYRQFCETIFGPLSLIFYNSAEWCRLFVASAPGWDLRFISSQLPFRSYRNLSILLHIHLHAKFVGRNSGKQHGSRDTFSSQKLTALWKLLLNHISKWKQPEFPSVWRNYYANDMESDNYLPLKKKTVIHWLQDHPYQTVLDIGANTGVFSVAAAYVCKDVIAIEPDIACAQELYCNLQQNDIRNVQVVVTDLVNPTPGTGWLNKEHPSFLQRASADTILALAVLHHLCISCCLPIAFIAKEFARIARHAVILEFVPKADPRVRQMLLNRKDIFDEYTEETMIDCFSRHFALESTYHFQNSERKLFLWTKR